MRGSGLAVAAAVAAGLVAGGAARASAETIGGVATSPGACAKNTEVLVGGAFSTDGQLTGFSFRALDPASGQADLQLLRPTTTSGQFKVQDRVTGQANPGGSVTVAVSAAMSVQAGDRIGEFVSAAGFPCRDTAASVKQTSATLTARPGKGDLVTLANPDAGGSNLAATIVPPSLGRPNLATASDTGISSTDNITAQTKPTFRGSGAVGGATISLLRDGTPVATTTATAAGNYSVTPGTPLADGSGVYTVTQTINGASSAPSAGVTVVVDSVAPSVSTPVTGSSVTVGGTVFYADQATVTIISADNGGGSGLVSTLCTFDGGQFNYNNTPVTPGQAISFGLEGLHTLNGCTATDVAGNAASSAAAQFYVDASAPVLDALTKTPGAAVANGPVAVGFSGSDHDRQPADASGYDLPDGGGSGIVAYEVTKSGAETGMQTVGGASGSVTVSAAGTTTVSVVAVDAVGHRSAAEQISVTIDLIAPTATVASFVQGGGKGAPVGPGVLRGAANDDRDVAGIQVRIRNASGSFDQTYVAACSGCGTPNATWSLDLNGSGIPIGPTLTATATATDSAGNVGQPSAPLAFATKNASTVATSAPALAARYVHHRTSTRRGHHDRRRVRARHLTRHAK